MGEAKEKKLSHVKELLQKALALNLYGAADMAALSCEEFARIYNGCGPEFLPSYVRDKLTAYLGIFEPAFLIHDWRFTSGNGGASDFNAANTELGFNLRLLAKAEYAWYNWRRYRALAVAELITDACTRFGWLAYISAVKTAMFMAIALSLLSGCYRSIELVREGEYTLTYTAVGLKTDVSKIEAEKTTNGTVRVVVEGVATDVSERNAKIIESSGTAVGNIAEKVVEGMK